ncbi:hypothetical protein PybrP1_000232 [[Pythium] brassicae (nom. inval.)]|nr:hypothetical protein PybrP1_000232 [[Pythium] brassicae (nom. inval.)]
MHRLSTSVAWTTRPWDSSVSRSVNSGRSHLRLLPQSAINGDGAAQPAESLGPAGPARGFESLADAGVPELNVPAAGETAMMYWAGRLAPSHMGPELEELHYRLRYWGVSVSLRKSSFGKLPEDAEGCAVVLRQSELLTQVHRGFLGACVGTLRAER